MLDHLGDVSDTHIHGVYQSQGVPWSDPKAVSNRRDEFRKLQKLTDKAIEAYQGDKVSAGKFPEHAEKIEADRGKVLHMLRKVKVYARQGLRKVEALRQARRPTQEGYDPAEKRDDSGQWTTGGGGGGGKSSEQEVIAHIKQSPQFAGKEIDWDRYASRFGIEGDFSHGTADVESLQKMMAGGYLRSSSKIDPEAVKAKVKSGKLNPVVIAKEPGRQMVIVDGTHSLQAALQAGIKSIPVIVSDKVSAHVLKEGYDPAEKRESWAPLQRGSS